MKYRLFFPLALYSSIMSNNIWFLPSVSQPSTDVSDPPTSGAVFSSPIEVNPPLVEPELSLADLPETDISLTESASSHSQRRDLQSIALDVLQPPSQRPRYVVWEHLLPHGRIIARIISQKRKKLGLGVKI